MASIKANGVLIRTLREELKIEGKSVSQMALANLSADREKLAKFKGEEPPNWINQFTDKWLSSIETKTVADVQEPLLKSLAYILGTSFASITFANYENPYKGLKAFGRDDAEFFGGRDDETVQVFERLKDHCLVGIIGASASGKSSLAFAGVCPMIERECPDWEMLSLRIGSKPLESLFYALDGWLFQGPEQRLDRPTRARKFEENIKQEDNTALYHYLAGAQRDTDKTPILVIDQWEELYTLCDDAKEQNVFLQNLINAVEKEVVRVLLTVRADFYDELLQSPPTFFAQLKPNLIDLQPMTAVQIQEAIEKPLEKTGFQFADGLIDRLVVAVGTEQGRLPILQFALSELWENRDVDRNWVSHEVYESLGGLEKIIETHANNVIANELNEEEQRIAAITLPALVNLGDHGNDIKLRASLAKFSPEQQAVLRLLSEENCRLVTLFRAGGADDFEESAEYVELVHEELIRSWPSLRNWLDKDLEFHQQRSRLERSYQHYLDNNQNDDFLIPEGKPLEDARQLLADYGNIFLEDLKPYIEKSKQKWRAIRNSEIDREKRQRALETELRKSAQVAANEAKAAAKDAISNESRATRSEMVARKRFVLASLAMLLAIVAAISASLGYINAQKIRTELEIRSADLEIQKEITDAANAELIQTNNRLQLANDIRFWFSGVEAIFERLAQACTDSSSSPNPTWRKVQKFSQRLNSEIRRFEIENGLESRQRCGPIQRVLKSTDVWSAAPERATNFRNNEVQRFLLAFEIVHDERALVLEMMNTQLVFSFRLPNPDLLKNSLVELCRLTEVQHCSQRKDKKTKFRSKEN